MHRRNITDSLRASLADTPVVFLTGGRQTGKTTLARTFINGARGRYVTLDDAPPLSAPASDPAGFIRNFNGLTVIDEVQKAPGLFPAIKAPVDVDRRPSRFLLTGSTDVMLLPRLAESLAGRMEIFQLWPFSQGELRGLREGFLRYSTLTGMLLSRDALARTDPARRPRLTAWADARATILQLCGGRHTLAEIEAATAARHPDLFRTPGKAAEFVAEVVTRYGRDDHDG